MATTQDISKLKTDYEAKISSLPDAGKAAAKAAWNRVLDNVKSLLVAKLNRLSILKLLDAKNIAKARAAANGLSNSVAQYKKSVQKPVKTLLSPSDAKATADLRNTVDALSKDEDSKAKVLGNNALRAQVCSDNKDLEINTLQKNISNLDSLRF